MNAQTLGLVLLCVGLNTAAQLMMKRGLMPLGELSLQGPALWTTLEKVLLNPFIVGGVGCFVLSLGVWLAVLSRLELSMAYPLTSLGYILTAFLGYLWLGEPLTLGRLVGILVIIIGVYLVCRT